MRQVGFRREAPIIAQASAEHLLQGARFNEGLAWLSRSTFMPKGVYRYKSHEEANRHQMDCLVRGMAQRAVERA